jgi:hypothetical protein
MEQTSSSQTHEIKQWLKDSNLNDLIPIFEMEQLFDWDYLKRLNIPLLHSIHVPMGSCFKFAEAIESNLC